MKFVGAHVSVAGALASAPANAATIGARAFALFTKNQRQWEAKPCEASAIEAFQRECARCGYDAAYILPHDSYLINLSSPEADKLEKSRRAFIGEMRRCEQLGLRLLNFHPGSHKKMIGVAEGIALIAAGVNMALAATESVTAVIENTAGQGGSLGRNFEEIAALIAPIKDKTRVGVCLDTCHLFASGYDIRDAATYAATMTEFDRVVGCQYLRAMHLNDAKARLGSQVDRHESIGKGEIGLEAFRLIMNDPRLDNMPLILETPDESLWAEEIRLLYSLMADPAKA